MVTLEDGAQYQEMTIGDGPSPKDGDRVAVHYSLFYKGEGGYEHGRRTPKEVALLEAVSITSCFYAARAPACRYRHLVLRSTQNTIPAAL